MFPHHSDQLSQRSKVSRVALSVSSSKVRTEWKLSGHYENCLDGLKTVRIVKKLSRLFRNSLDGLITVRTVSNCIKSILKIIQIVMSRERITRFFVCCKRGLRIFYMSWEMFPRASSRKFLRVNSRYPESFRFLCLWRIVRCPLVEVFHCQYDFQPSGSCCLPCQPRIVLEGCQIARQFSKTV